MFVVLLDIAPLLRWRSFRGRRQLPQAGEVCANGPCRVLCLINVTLVMSRAEWPSGLCVVLAIALAIVPAIVLAIVPATVLAIVLAIVIALVLCGLGHGGVHVSWPLY